MLSPPTCVLNNHYSSVYGSKYSTTQLLKPNFLETVISPSLSGLC